MDCDYSRDSDGDYANPHVQSTWEGYQVGRAHAAAGIKKLEEALRFYADGSHFMLHDPSAWDTVSGEPPNFYEDESNTATVEDGSVAKMALEGRAMAPADQPT